MATYAGLALAIFNQLTPITRLLYRTISDERDFGSDATALRIRMDDEQLRLRALQQLQFTSSPVATTPSGCLFDQFEAEWQFTILEMQRQLRKQLSDYLPLQIEYKISRSEQPLDPSDATVEALSNDFVNQSTLEEKFHRSTSKFRKFKFALRDKKRASKIVQDFTEWNDRVQRNLELILLRVKLLGNPLGLRTLQSDNNAVVLGLSQKAGLQQILMDKDSIKDMRLPRDAIVLANEKLAYMDVTVLKSKPERKLVEYQRFAPVDGKAHKTDVESMNQLAALLKEATRTEFRAFRCAGFFEDVGYNQWVFSSIFRAGYRWPGYSHFWTHTKRKSQRWENASSFVTISAVHLQRSMLSGGSTRACAATLSSSSIIALQIQLPNRRNTNHRFLALNTPVQRPKLLADIMMTFPSAIFTDIH